MIQAVFFDLDDTLHDAQFPLEDAIKKLFPEVAASEDMNQFYKKFRDCSDILWKDYVNHNISLNELRVRRIIMALQQVGYEIDASQATLFQEQYEINQRELRIFPEAPTIFNQLKEKNILVGMITNGPVEHQLNKIHSLGLTKHIPEPLIFVSDGVGVAKPNPDIFHHVQNKVNIRPDHMLYIGDSWENDIAGSCNAGWKSIWFNHRKREPETNHQPIAVINNLSEMVKFLG